MTGTKKHKVSRRVAMKICLIPASSVTAGWFVGCSEGDSESDPTAGWQTGSDVPPVNASNPNAIAETSTPMPMVEPPPMPQAGDTAAEADNGVQGVPSADSGPPDSVPPTGGPPAMTDADASVAMERPQDDPEVEDEPTADDMPGSAVAEPGAPWATGGTAAIVDSLPDPFEENGPGTACRLYPSQTLGPCYANGPANRRDISDSAPGLPTRLSFLVTQSDGCTPVADATVDIWHSGFDGVYSAFASGICNPDRLPVGNQMFCRGVQITDAQGRVDFDTIFPGWYTGRTIHIHFTISINGRSAVTSQLYFEDELSDEILAQGEYARRGPRNTTNSRDSIFASGGATPDQVILSTVKRPGGILHAWKTLAIG